MRWEKCEKKPSWSPEQREGEPLELKVPPAALPFQKVPPYWGQTGRKAWIYCPLKVRVITAMSRHKG